MCKASLGRQLGFWKNYSIGSSGLLMIHSFKLHSSRIPFGAAFPFNLPLLEWIAVSALRALPRALPGIRRSWMKHFHDEVAVQALRRLAIYKSTLGFYGFTHTVSGTPKRLFLLF
jgi:hypothetical protein